MGTTRSMETFLEELGSSAPAPGGGAASAVAGALAAALAEMVAQLTVNKPRFAEVQTTMRSAIERTRAARDDLLRLVTEDEAAFQRVSAAYRLPRTSDGERSKRSAAIQEALAEAMQPPLQIMRRACEVVELAAQIAMSGNPTVASDAGCAALIGEAAVRAAGLNVLANVVLLNDAAKASAAREEMARCEQRAARAREETLRTVAERMRA